MVTKSWSLTTSLPSVTDGLPTYIVQLPIPGVAYLYGQILSGNLNLTPVYFSDYSTIFPANYETTSVTSFRYAGHAMEVVPTVNAMTWTGSVQIFRGPVTLSLTAISNAATAFVVDGLGSMINSGRPDAVHPFNLGCYCASRQVQPDFPFHQITPQTVFNEVPVSNQAGGVTVAMPAGTSFPGLGSMEAIIFKIPSYSATGNAATLRFWAHTEFQVSSASFLYEFAHMSPTHDPLAMKLLKDAFKEMQLCVPYYENDGMWDRVLNFIRRAASLAAFIPGPIGEIGYGVKVASDAIYGLTL